MHDLAARVHQQKTAGAIRVLGLAGAEAGLAHQRRLLIAQNARDGNAPHGFESGLAVRLAARRDARQNAPRDAERAQQFRVPIERLPGSSTACGWRWCNR